MGLALFGVLAMIAVPASGQTAENDDLAELETERDLVMSQQAAKAVEIDVANADITELSQTLADLEVQVVAQTDEVNRANQEFDEAILAADVAAENVRVKAAEVNDLEARLADHALRSFVGDEPSRLLVGLDAPPLEAIHMRTLLRVVTDVKVDLTAALRAATEQLVAEQAKAVSQVESAESLRQQADVELAILEADRVAFAELKSASEERLDHLLSEQAALATLGADIDDRIAGLVEALATEPAPAPPVETAPPPLVAADEIENAGSGIWVHSSIVDNIRRLLADAAAAGVVLGGGGYRDPQAQIALREAHCGTTDYAIYQMPSSQCSPPTARPGRSMHEKGLAIDFTYNDRIIGSRSGPAWNWLNTHAANYGLINLPVEPWHWSTNGN